jgi:hypothetical protein
MERGGKIAQVETDYRIIEVQGKSQKKEKVRQ